MASKITLEIEKVDSGSAFRVSALGVHYTDAKMSVAIIKVIEHLYTERNKLTAVESMLSDAGLDRLYLINRTLYNCMPEAGPIQGETRKIGKEAK